ncbi:hypothetical protein F5Y16DRAFT_405790 [Xylariaceae sp. FL0255]|nr:hypothetical protein F5Y16DRAFT_405790 [Xylariaceae sp. FL0255]
MANPHPIPRIYPEPPPYKQQDAIKEGIRGALYGGASGFAVSAVQNALAKHRVGVWGVFTRTGGTIALFMAPMTIFDFTRAASGNLRQSDDAYNTAIAGFLAGASVGLRTSRMPAILGYGALFSIVTTAFDVTGGTLRGKRTEMEGMDEYERKEYLRTNRRRPIEETISEIGEGRGIYPPGYEERRRERLKEKYGVDINPVSTLVDE